MGLLLSLARRIPELDAAIKTGEWRRGIAADVCGQTLGLVGTGRIGMGVARRAKAFGMRLLAADPYPNALFIEELGGDYVSVDDVLERSDFVSLHCPAGSETRGMIGAAQLARMKPTAFLLNLARGALIDEPALIAALRENRIAGAGLDVLAVEPPTPGSPSDELARLPNVLVTPHVASFTPRTAARMARASMENLLTALRGERPQHVANPAVYARGLRE
jgi:phosphoglycerate dehydrogenase-like enzyme